MPIDSHHPSFDVFAEDWQTMRDTYCGERAVKQRGFTYLPPTEGMIDEGIDSAQYSTAATNFGSQGLYIGSTRGSRGWRRYVAYRGRALFYDFVSEAVRASIGVMHHKPPTITVPKALEPMIKRATAHGDSIELLLRKLNEQQLVTGRVGLLLDMPERPDPENPLPHLALYWAERCINWDDGARSEADLPRLNMVVIDECGAEREGFEWKSRDGYRVLILGDPDQNESAGEAATYRVAVLDGKVDALDVSLLKAPNIRGRTLDQIPFRFVNAQDAESCPADPPLMGLARLSLAIYRGDADYRLGLFQQAQASLVRIGVIDDDDDVSVGAGRTIDLPQGGDAKYIVAPAEGLAAQRNALNDDKMIASNRAMTLIERGGQKEGAETHRLRTAARTASLNQIALAGAAAVEDLLKVAATWVGANPDEVSVTPNLEFASARMAAREAIELWTAKQLGAPISRRTYHAQLKRGELTELSFEDEESEIEGEPDLTAGGGVIEEDPLDADPED